MDKDTVIGTAKEIDGKIRSVVGYATGNKENEVRGKAEEAEGKMQKNYGKVKEIIKDVVNN